MDLWIEKYRPQNLNDIIGQDVTIKTLEHYVKTQNIPNLIFYGSRGCGKTSTIHALCKDLYGEDYKKYVLELNASHERGINTIRTKVKTMAQTKTSKIKMIILDEADSMTKEAMFSLRMIMENYSHITRFCLICNYINKIIDPLQSRCTVFYFQPLQQNEMIRKLKQINGKDNKELIKYSDGDMRRATMIIQYSIGQDINNLFAISEEICDKLLNDLMTKPLDIILDTCFDIHKSAYDKSKIIELLGEKILKTKNIPNKEKILFLIGEKDVDIQQGMWDYIELVDMCSKIEFLLKQK
jgi:replication factor C small subunit